MTTRTTTAEFFETKYRADADPWSFASSEYELSRYSAIVAALGNRRFASAFEPGCSVGVLTAQLAHWCDRLLACDLSGTAVAQARARVEGEACRLAQPCRVTVEVASLQTAPLPRALDLVVFSEIGYYFSEDALAVQRDRLVDSIAPGGLLVAAHWLGTSRDHVLHGARVHEIIGAHPQLLRMRPTASNGFMLDLWKRVQ